MKTILILGASGANRLAKSLFSNMEIISKYRIQNVTKNGANVQDLNFGPLQYLKNGDILLIQIFGNQLMKRNIKVTYKEMKKIIHLTKFERESDEKILQDYRFLSDKLSSLPDGVKVYLIDNPIRHLQCCLEHNFPGLLSFQDGQNRILKRFFEPKFIVIKHEKLLQGSRQYIKANYCKYFADTVHFKRHVYDEMAKKLLALLEERKDMRPVAWCP